MIVLPSAACVSALKCYKVLPWSCGFRIKFQGQSVVGAPAAVLASVPVVFLVNFFSAFVDLSLQVTGVGVPFGDERTVIFHRTLIRGTQIERLASDLFVDQRGHCITFAFRDKILTKIKKRKMFCRGGVVVPFVLIIRNEAMTETIRWTSMIDAEVLSGFTSWSPT